MTLLLHPFLAEGEALPTEEDQIFFLRATPDPVWEAWRRALVCEQSFKPTHDALVRQGFKTTPRIVEGTARVVLCAFTKHRGETLANLARAWTLLAPGGLLVCAGSNDTGAASLIRALGKAVEGGISASKHHGRVFWVRRPPEERGLVEPMTGWLAAGALQPVAALDGRFSRPGVYGWDKVDQGSRLLAEYLAAHREQIRGHVADVGAGWGYLGLQLLEVCPHLDALDLIEAEGLAVEAARANLGELTQRQQALTRVVWQDAAAEPLPRRYDWIVCNPPFHQGKATDLGLGKAIVSTAAAALHRGGRFLMVANRHLSYEAHLDACFSSWRDVGGDASFKLIEATVS